MSLFQCFESVGVNTGKFHALIISSLVGFVIFFRGASKYRKKIGKRWKKSKTKKDQKAKKPRFPPSKTLENIRGQVKNGLLKRPFSP